jgi:hypothetical protein
MVSRRSATLPPSGLTDALAWARPWVDSGHALSLWA